MRKNHLKPLYLLGVCNNLFIFDQYNFSLLTNYLKALVLRFSRTYNCLHFFRLRSNGNSFLSFWIEVRINIFVLRDFTNLLHFYFLNICSQICHFHNLLSESFIHEWSVVTPDVRFYGEPIYLECFDNFPKDYWIHHYC